MEKSILAKRKVQKLAREGHLQQACEEMRRLLGEAEVDPYDYVYLGDLLLRLGETADAVDSWQQAVESYESAGLYRNAIAICKKILRLERGGAQIHATLGELFLQEGLPGDATEHLLAYLDYSSREPSLSERFVPTLEKTAAIPSLRPEEVLRLSEHCTRAGREDLASTLLQKLADQVQHEGESGLAGDLREKASRAEVSLLARRSAEARESGRPEESATPVVLHEVVEREPAVPEPGADIEREDRSESPSAAFPGIGEEIVDTPSPATTEPAASVAAGAATVAGDTTSATESRAAAAAPPPLLEQTSLAADPVEGPVSSFAGWTGTSELETNYPESQVAGGDEPTARPAGQDEADGEDARDLPAPRALAFERFPGPVAPPKPVAGDSPASQAAEAYRRQDWEEAKRLYEELLHSPADLRANLERLVDIARRVGDPREEIRYLTALGDAWIEDGDLPRAMGIFLRVEALDPNDATAYRRLTRFRTMGLTGMEVVAGGAANSPPSSPTAGEAGAGSSPHGETGNAEWVDLGALLQEFSQEVKKQIDANDYQSHYDLAVSHRCMGLWEEAVEEIDLVLDHPALPAGWILQARDLKGECLAALQRFRESIHEFRTALEQGAAEGQRRWSLLHRLGGALEAAGEWREAAETYEKICRETRGFLDTEARLAACRQRAGSPDREAA